LEVQRAAPHEEVTECYPLASSLFSPDKIPRCSDDSHWCCSTVVSQPRKYWDITEWKLVQPLRYLWLSTALRGN